MATLRAFVNCLLNNDVSVYLVTDTKGNNADQPPSVAILALHLLLMRCRISNRNFWEGQGDPASDGVEGANRIKAYRGCPLPIHVSKTLHQFEKLEPLEL